MKNLIIAVLALSLLGLAVLTTKEAVEAPAVDQQGSRDSDSSAVEASSEESGSIIDSVASLGGSSVEIYDGISVKESATQIDLSGRSLTGSLKAEIRYVSNVRSLDLSNNKFTGLPAEVGQLSGLEVLNLSNNKFTGLPHELGNLQNLKELDLRGNNISGFDLKIIRDRLPLSTQILTD